MLFNFTLIGLFNQSLSIKFIFRTILASCGFDKQLKTWMPPPPTSETIGGKKSTEWQEITNKAVDRRGSVTDVRLVLRIL